MISFRIIYRDKFSENANPTISVQSSFLLGLKLPPIMPTHLIYAKPSDIS